MSRQSITDLLYRRGIDDPATHAVADEADYRIECLESRLADLEAKHLATRRALAALAGHAAWLKNELVCPCVRICPICGALGDEPCDAGLHG